MGSKPHITTPYRTFEASTDNSMKMSDQSSVAARKTNTMLAIIKSGIQNKENNKIKPLCKLLRHKEYSRPEEGAVKGGPGCQNMDQTKSKYLNSKKAWRKHQ